VLVHTVLIRPKASVAGSDLDALSQQTARIAERLCGPGNFDVGPTVRRNRSTRDISSGSFCVLPTETHSPRITAIRSTICSASAFRNSPKRSSSMTWKPRSGSATRRPPGAPLQARQ
jgi:hypothetical protein